MNHPELSKKIKDLRVKKAMSQEELAEKTGLSLRTIQRIENGETEPRGDSLKRIAIALSVTPEELLDWEKEENYGLLAVLNLSALSLFLFPLLGVIVPLVIWLANKSKVKGIDQVAKKLINFQITWCLIYFLYSALIMLQFVFHFSLFIKGPKSMFLSTAGVYGLLYVYNVVFILINSYKIYYGRQVRYFPSIRFMH
jgi:transcriptional regulator with XRE-family HTH domain